MTRFVSALVAASFAAGCSQADPAQNDGAPGGADGGVAPGLYFPLVDGATWTYRHSSGWDETVTAEAATFGEADAFTWSDTENPNGASGRATLVRRGTRVLRVHKEAFITAFGATEPSLAFTVDYDPGFVRFDDAWLDKTPPYEETLTYTRIETLPELPPNAPDDRAHIFTVESLAEEVETPAGTFRDCVRLRRKRNYMSALGPEDEEKLFFFAPGVGKVREENLTSGSTEELLEYSIP